MCLWEIECRIQNERNMNNIFKHNLYMVCMNAFKKHGPIQTREEIWKCIYTCSALSQSTHLTFSHHGDLWVTKGLQDFSMARVADDTWHLYMLLVGTNLFKHGQENRERINMCSALSQKNVYILEQYLKGQELPWCVLVEKCTWM